MRHIPANFLQSDIQHDGQRHLLFMSDLQMRYLAEARAWYIDGTFKAARKPFIQLVSIHCFITSEDGDGAMKQVPLCYILMSRRKKVDYKAVLDAVIALLPTRPVVEEIILDFERAVWAAIRICLPQAQIFGCWFHWAQAVFNKVCIILNILSYILKIYF